MIHGRYRVLTKLAEGGMGITYRAWDSCRSVPVVIKMPRPGGSGSAGERVLLIRRFANEIVVMRGLPHAHIVPITDSGEHDGLPFAAMRFLPGGSLDDRRPKGNSPKARRMAPSTLWRWLPDVADALDFIHARGVVHRDVKPSNIFFDGQWKAFLGDFGIAKILNESLELKSGEALTTVGSGIGTLEYMAPELLRPNLHPTGRSDQYSLGIVIYEILSGGRPFTGGVHDIRVEHAALRPPPLDYLRLPSSLTEAIDRALAKNPEQRFATCRSFVEEALRKVQRPDKEEAVVRLLCPGCKSVLKLSPTTGGKRGKCPECKAPVETAEHCVALWLQAEALSLGKAEPLQAEALSLGKAETSIPISQGGRTWDITATIYRPVSKEIVGGDLAEQESTQTPPTFPEHRRWRWLASIAWPIAIILILVVVMVVARLFSGDGGQEVAEVATLTGRTLTGRTLTLDLEGEKNTYEAMEDGTFKDTTREKKEGVTYPYQEWKLITGDENDLPEGSGTYFEVTKNSKPWLIIVLRKDSEEIFSIDERGLNTTLDNSSEGKVSGPKGQN